MCLCVGLFLCVCRYVIEEKEDEGEEKKSELEGEKREKKELNWEINKIISAKL